MSLFLFVVLKNAISKYVVLRCTWLYSLYVICPTGTSKMRGIFLSLSHINCGQFLLF